MAENGLAAASSSMAALFGHVAVRNVVPGGSSGGMPFGGDCTSTATTSCPCWTSSLTRTSADVARSAGDQNRHALTTSLRWESARRL